MKKIYRFRVNHKNIVSVEAGAILEAKKAIVKEYPMARFNNIKIKYED